MANKAPKKAAKTAAKTVERRPPAGTKSVLVYLPTELVANLEQWAANINAAEVGPQWSRSDVVKAALARAWTERGSKGERP